MKSIGETESAGLWGLDRVDQKPLKRDYMYHYSYTGSGVHVYTVDTVCAFPLCKQVFYDTTECNDCKGHNTSLEVHLLLDVMNLGHLKPGCPCVGY